MQDNPTFNTASGQPGAVAAAAPGRLVTDAPTRMFHWLFALSFLGAYVTADGEHWRLLHVTLGYTMAGLLAFRVLYGLFGPRQAGLGLLWRKLGAAPVWLRSVRAAVSSGSVAGINWRQGQNLLMALAVVALLLLVVPLTLSGYGTYNDWGDVLGGDWLEELHEFFGEAFLFVVLAHLALIAALSLLRRKNLALPMLNGRVEGPGPNLVQHNRGWLAALLLIAVLAYGAWEWQQSPKGLVSAQALSSLATGDSRGGGQDGDDD
ncbi:cytochrome b/b6 domain-containing protein [Hydrogenophaga sp.]|uniref:cytochrome b/b6 domain-containing protein n=1 Tax=Hydrogenophaga sp. TaxID=1904254 RepID=UPI00272022E5|nr:cytochrome b/b6 domain-containing protein [Hydrogenophaga sp.]MDO8906206.1 cytochrome b/b6 domain-containing protein [Hydrogenophaga sp.]